MDSVSPKNSASMRREITREKGLMVLGGSQARNEGDPSPARSVRFSN